MRQLLKVFASLFSKSDRRSNARSVGRASQGAKSLIRRFLLLSFSFAPAVTKEKRVIDLEILYGIRGNPHLCVPPLSSLWLEIHPFVALSNDKDISPSAEGDRRSRRLRRAFEKARAKLSNGFALNSPLNSNLSTIMPF